jgi:hypothetical protein
MLIDKLLPALMAQNKTLKPMLEIAHKKERLVMKKYLVTIRLTGGKNDYYECEAESEFDAEQQAGWAYVREGVVTNVSEANRGRLYRC